MKLSKHVRYLVRIRDYETVQIEVGAEVDHHDLGYTDTQWANLTQSQVETFTEHLETLLVTEVEKIASEELDQVSQWSEISPNLAEDYLSSAHLPSARSQRARNQKAAATSAADRKLTRTRNHNPPPTPAA